jgi:hypothetical protein
MEGKNICSECGAAMVDSTFYHNGVETPLRWCLTDGCKRRAIIESFVNGKWIDCEGKDAD